MTNQVVQQTRNVMIKGIVISQSVDRCREWIRSELIDDDKYYIMINGFANGQGVHVRGLPKTTPWTTVDFELSEEWKTINRDLWNELHMHFGAKKDHATFASIAKHR